MSRVRLQRRHRVRGGVTEEKLCASKRSGICHAIGAGRARRHGIHGGCLVCNGNETVTR